jgi:hypothetical protein
LFPPRRPTIARQFPWREGRQKRSASQRTPETKASYQGGRFLPLSPWMWKTRPEARIRAVIARDTTYCVSLLTGTICRSNFAIPSRQIPPPKEMGMEFAVWIRRERDTTRLGVRPGVTCRFAAQKVRGRLSHQINRPSAPKPELESASGCRKPEANTKCGDRAPKPPPEHDS